MKIVLGVVTLLFAGLAFGDENLVGAWMLTIDTPRGVNHPLLTIERTEHGYSGIMNGRRGEVVIPSITVEGAKFSFPMKVSMPFGEFDMTYTGVTAAEQMRGEVRGPRGGIPFTGTKSPPR